MNYYKQLGKNRKKEELPSFLVGLTDAPEDITFAPKPNPSTHYLGPIFVGLCTNYQHHAPPHSLKLGSFHQPQFIMLPGADDISKLLYSQTKADKITQTMSLHKRGVKRQKIYHDIYPHKCTGSKKMFIPDVTPHVIDLGKTRSIIEGETSVEIPLSRSQNVPFHHRRKSVSKRENDFITLSDIREERRMFMSYKERIAHAHYPKEFMTVRVIGPTIPASITITKLPSKRKTESQLTLELKSETRKEGTAEETEDIRRRSTKSKSVTTASGKKFSSKPIKQNFEDLVKAEEEIETRDKVSVGSPLVFEEGEEEEGEEGEGEKEEEEVVEEEAEEKLEEIEGEKEEIEEEDKEEENLKTEEREERQTIVKEEPKAEEKEETKTDIKEETKTVVKEEPKTVVKEEPKTEEKEDTKTDVKEETKTVVKEEPKTEIKEETKTVVKEEPKTEVKEETKTEVKEEKIRLVQIKQEEAVSEKNAGGSAATVKKEDENEDQESNTSTVVQEAEE